jgi:hypothetical protein
MIKFVKLCWDTAHSQYMTPIDFEVIRSKFKVTLCTILVLLITRKTFSSSLIDIEGTLPMTGHLWSLGQVTVILCVKFLSDQ